MIDVMVMDTSIDRTNTVDINNIYLKPTIYTILNEARGISMECNVEASKIASALRNIVNKVNNGKCINASGQRIGIVKNGCNLFNVFNETITVEWEYYNFDKREWMDKYYESIPKNDFFDKTKKKISISLFGVSGDLDVRNCENTIAHEIFHNYKNLKPINNKEHSLAKIANNIVGAPSIYYETELIGRIMYLLSNEEIQAFCNGAYAQIKKDINTGKRLSLEDFIEKTILYENFSTLDYLLNDFKKKVNEQIYNKCCLQIKSLTKKQMMPYKSFVKYIEDGRRNYFYQIGRLKSMLIDDFKLEESAIFFEKYF